MLFFGRSLFSDVKAGSKQAEADARYLAAKMKGGLGGGGSLKPIC